jgi:hypothetical protein
MVPTCTGEIADFVDAGDTVVYEIGCNGARYGEGSSHVSLTALSCSDRRVQCVHGFPAKDPRQARCPIRKGPTNDVGNSN